MNQSEELSIKFKNSVNNQFSSTRGKDDINFNGLNQKAIKEMIKEAEREKKSLMRRVNFLDGRLKNLRNCLKGRRKESDETQGEVSFTPRSQNNRSWKIGKSRSLRELESSKANFGSEDNKTKFEQMKDKKPKLDEKKLKAVNCIVSPTRIPLKTESRKKEKERVDKAVPCSPGLKDIAIQSTDFQIDERDIVYSQRLITRWERTTRNSKTTEGETSRYDGSPIKKQSNFKIWNRSLNVQSIIQPRDTTSDSMHRPNYKPPHTGYRQYHSQFRPKKSLAKNHRVRNISHFSAGNGAYRRSKSYSRGPEQEMCEEEYDNVDASSYLLENQQESPQRFRHHSAAPSRRMKIRVGQNPKKSKRKKINFSYQKNNKFYSPLKKQKNIRYRKRRNLRTKSSIKPSIYYN